MELIEILLRIVVLLALGLIYFIRLLISYYKVHYIQLIFSLSFPFLYAVIEQNCFEILGSFQSKYVPFKLGVSAILFMIIGMFTTCMGNLISNSITSNKSYCRNKTLQKIISSKKSHKDKQNRIKKNSTKKATYYELMAIGDADLVNNSEPFICHICFSNVEIGEGILLQDCLHNFCRKCLIIEIRNSDSIIVKCPLKFICIPVRIIFEKEKLKLVSGQEYEHLLQNSLSIAESQASNSFHCRTLDCPGWCFFENNVQTFFCPACKRINCLTCKAIHEGLSCKQYEEQLEDDDDSYEDAYDFLQTFHCRTPDCPGVYLFENNDEIFHCPACKRTNCLTCKVIHEGKTCQQYEEQLEHDCESCEEAEEFLQSEHYKAWGNEYIKRANYDALVALDDADLVLNMKPFVCPICFLDVKTNEGVILQDCLHGFCRECLSSSIEYSEEAVIKCPFLDDVYSCESYLRDREIKNLVSPDIYDHILQKSLALAESQAENSFHCKTADCRGFCFFEDDVNTFLCPVCDKTNCLTCAAIHEGKNCKQYQDEFMKSEEAKKTKKYFQGLLKSGDTMNCPQCRIFIMKKSGCDWLRCSMCHTEVCWVTKGPRWGPKGKEILVVVANVSGTMSVAIQIVAIVTKEKRRFIGIDGKPLK
ncbi:hypothetical protein CEXT_202222 [Caerostris extrusa]|uniref:RanBP-type and C3HC4-type zinc finger-containing protein 1 n=1 Tax=Caerostris extrusa TaxID=172846 RepID=A0AAV4T3I1_CAEEX|nr:hypothetical protein CEXT_202222 [Caerostris extrusa]